MINSRTFFLLAQAVASELQNDKLEGFAREFEELNDEFTALKYQMGSFTENQSDESLVNDIATITRHLAAEAIQLYASVEKIKRNGGF